MKHPIGLPPSQTHGPLVQTGSRRGENRARNLDGSWRAKRSDAGKPRGNPLSPK